jgi:Spy/CpxP family protein refolding chaperone
MLPAGLFRVIESMNTYSSLKRAVFVALALGAASATAAFADTASTTDTTTTDTTTAPTGGWHHHHHGAGVLTAAEKAELKADRDKVFAANPTLKTQHETLKEQFKALHSQGTTPTEAQVQALKTQKDALKAQMRTAIENVDSNAAPIFAKLDAARAAHHHSS